MVVDVIDIRKRIEKIRTEVSDAIVSQKTFNLPTEKLREDVEMKISAPTQNDASKKGKTAQGPISGDSDTAYSTHKAMTQMMAMPSFTLNVKNRHSSRLLITLVTLQMLTNLLLIALLLIKLG